MAFDLKEFLLIKSNIFIGCSLFAVWVYWIQETANSNSFRILKILSSLIKTVLVNVHFQKEKLSCSYSAQGLTLSWQRSLSYRKHLLCKPMDWFLYGRNIRHERAKNLLVKVCYQYKGIKFFKCTIVLKSIFRGSVSLIVKDLFKVNNKNTGTIFQIFSNSVCIWSLLQ